ncbi:unnamed protein product, partial [Hapterophycus canaliculatus]
RPPSGVSLKTQELFFVVFVSRYVDLFFRFHSWYNRWVAQVSGRGFD